MPNKILLAADGTPIVWADSADYAGQGGTRTHQITLAGLGSMDARQGEKADMDRGVVADRMAQRWAVTLRIEMNVAPANYKTVDLFWAPSLSATPADANPGGTTGADAAYTGTAGSTIGESLMQLQRIGALPLTNDADGVIQQKTFITTLPTQWGMPVVHNYSDQAFEGDDVEMSITFTPLEDESQ